MVAVEHGERDDSVDVLLIDLESGDDDALRAVPKILARYSGVPSLALVSDLNPELERRVRSLGIDVVRRRPNRTVLTLNATVQSIISILRATQLVHGKRASFSPKKEGRAAPIAHRSAGTHTPHTPEVRERAIADRVLAIGASTGGPPAVRTVLSALTSTERYAILIVQHISSGFSGGYGRWLGETTGHAVREAIEGETVRAGTVLVAPGDVHLVVRDRRIAFDGSERRNFQKPSVDALFESVAREYGTACVAVLLTGMGRDGAEGCRAVRAAGGYVVAQDEASSVVWGMPRAAVELDAADEILTIEAIAECVESYLLKEGGARTPNDDPMP